MARASYHKAAATLTQGATLVSHAVLIAYKGRSVVVARSDEERDIAKMGLVWFTPGLVILEAH